MRADYQRESNEMVERNCYQYQARQLPYDPQRDARFLPHSITMINSMKNSPRPIASRFIVAIELWMAIAMLSTMSLDAQSAHEVVPIATLLLREHGHRPTFPDSTATVRASTVCLERVSADTLVNEAGLLLEHYAKNYTPAVTFVCGPQGLMPQDHIIGFSRGSGGPCSTVNITLYRVADDGTLGSKVFIREGTTGWDFQVMGYLGKLEEPWGFIVRSGECRYIKWTVFDLDGSVVNEFGGWGSPILTLDDDVVDLVWMQADGVHRHHTEPVVVWKLFRNARYPEIIGQQMMWTLVDDLTGETNRVLRHHRALRVEYSKKYPQRIP